MRKWLIADSSNTSPVVYWVNLFWVVALLVGLAAFSFSALGYPLMWSHVWKYKDNMLRGFFMTLLISFLALGSSLLIGIFFGLAQRSRLIMLRLTARMYIELIRGTPLLVQVLIFFYVVAHALNINDRMLVGISIMSIFSGAYIAEIVRAGIESIAQSQLETARSLGFTRFQMYRYIIFPQVFTRILPPLTGQLASLIKDSSLLSVIAIKEFTMAAREVNATTFSTLESYLPLALGYLLLTLPISQLTRMLEKKFRYDT